LGLTFYELGDFEQAIRYLKTVSENDENYPQALLALGWCYLKLQQYQYMIAPLESFLTRYPDHPSAPEVYLLMGQAHLKLRLYDKSIYYFSKILNIFPLSKEKEEMIARFNKRLRQFEENVEQQRLDLIVLQSKLLDSIYFDNEKRRWIPDFMQEEIRKLREKRRQLLNDIDAEKANIRDLEISIEDLRQKIKVRSKNWRGFAEYGISRALFLKEREE